MEPAEEVAEEAAAGSTHFYPCTLVIGCTLPAWHLGICHCSSFQGKSRERKAIKHFEAEPAPPLVKKVKLANAPLGQANSKDAKDDPKKHGKKRKKDAEVVEETAADDKKRKRAAVAVQPVSRVGSRAGTRSRGQPVWEPDAVPQDDDATHPVAAALSIGADGRVGLSLSMRPRGEPKKVNKGLSALRDFLAKGHADPFANESCTSIACEMLEQKRDGSDIKWGCLCRGNSFKGGAELTCNKCDLTFHAKCERLDYSPSELQAMVEKKSYVCSDCERKARVEEGYDPALGRFTWQCRHCTRFFEEEESHAAEKHGQRCARELARRQWSCACNGKMANTKMMATQCTGCAMWFHGACKSQLRNAWDGNVAGKKLQAALREMCASCEKAALSRGSKGAGSSSGEPLAEAETGNARATKSAALGSELTALTASSHAQTKMPGNLRDGRVYVAPSGLGEDAGLGLYAGVAIKRGGVVTPYYGVPLYKEQLEPSHDTSYIMRLPNSGGVLLNGKPFADALRANPANPATDGKYYPVDGAAEWTLGAGSLANDPRDRRRNNAMLNFVKPKIDGANKFVCELAPVLPVLMATRDLEVGEEVFYSYGSDKPFEHIRKMLQQQAKESQKGKRDEVKLVWVPHDA